MKIVGLIVFSIIVFGFICAIVSASNSNRDRYKFMLEGIEKEIEKEKKDAQ
jgi:hypothetical protein